MSAFAGETTTDVERDSAYCDYTWNWSGHGDYRPLTSVLPAPRFNMNVDHSGRDVKMIFMDNGLVNAMPAVPDGVSGSGMLKDFPELSRSLKQCAKLRQEFLPYFTQGILIGECILTEAADSFYANGYILSDRALIVGMNLGNERTISFNSNIGYWLKSPSDRYKIKTYDDDGKLIEETELQGPLLRLKTPKLQTDQMMLYEILPATST